MAKQLLRLRFGPCHFKTLMPILERDFPTTRESDVYTGVVNGSVQNADPSEIPGFGFMVDEALHVLSDADWELITVLPDPKTGEVKEMYFKRA